MKPSLRQRPWVKVVGGGMSIVIVAASMVGSCSATIEAVDGCEHSSECVANYWRMIWTIIAFVSIIYFMLLAWTCWISSKLRHKK